MWLTQDGGVLRIPQVLRDQGQPGIQTRLRARFRPQVAASHPRAQPAAEWLLRGRLRRRVEYPGRHDPHGHPKEVLARAVSSTRLLPDTPSIHFFGPLSFRVHERILSGGGVSSNAALATSFLAVAEEIYRTRGLGGLYAGFTFKVRRLFTWAWGESDWLTCPSHLYAPCRPSPCCRRSTWAAAARSWPSSSPFSRRFSKCRREYILFSLLGEGEKRTQRQRPGPLFIFDT